MFFEIFHNTEYHYSEPVFLEPHYFRFKPKATPYNKICQFQIDVKPKPKSLAHQIDSENNHLAYLWFNDTHAQLNVTAYAKIEVTPFNPFLFYIHPKDFLTLPFTYDKNTKNILQPSLAHLPLNDEITEYLHAILTKSKNKTVDFLVTLTQNIHQNFHLEYRETGVPFHPNQTFTYKRGSCRDLAWMQIQMFRHLGLASRFVSGYFYIEEEAHFELHAWVEVYIPGGGWIGLDPSHGILTEAFHIPVASSAYHENTMPISGTIRGKAQSFLHHDLKIILQK